MRIFLAQVETFARGDQLIRRAAFDRTGITDYQAVEIRPGRFVCVAPFVNAAPSGTIDLGDTTTVIPTNREAQVANFLGVTRAEVSGKTIGELILLYEGGTWAPGRDRKVRIALAGVTLYEADAIGGGAVEITDPFTYSNGRLSTVSSGAWDDESSNMAVSGNAVVWSTTNDAGIASHNTELSSATHYAEVKITLGNTSEYTAGGVVVRNDGLAVSQDGYRVELGHWQNPTVASNIGITRYDNGTGTEVSVTAIGSPSLSQRTLRAEADGTTITVFVNDVEEASYGSASSYTTNTFVGIFASMFGQITTVTLDDFEAGTLGADPQTIVGTSAAITVAAASQSFTPGTALIIGAAAAIVISAATGTITASGAPTLLTPLDEASVDLNDGETFTWDHGGAGAQTDFAFRRRRLPGGDWEWWNGTGWQPTEVFIASSTESVTIPSGEW